MSGIIPPSWNFIDTAVVQSPQDFINWIGQGLEYRIPTNKITKKFYAGENIVAGDAVFIDTDNKLYIFDITNSSCFPKYVGVSETTVQTGQVCTVVVCGLLAVGASGYQPGIPYYISASGQLTSVVNALYTNQVAIGVDYNRVLVIPTGSATSPSPSTGCDVTIDGGVFLSPGDNTTIDGGVFIC